MLVGPGMDDSDKDAELSSEDRHGPERAQEIQHTNDDDDDAYDLLSATIERKHINEVEAENDDQERDQYADKQVHGGSLKKGKTVHQWQSPL
jgi:hypothetical protein